MPIILAHNNYKSTIINTRQNTSLLDYGRLILCYQVKQVIFSSFYRQMVKFVYGEKKMKLWTQTVSRVLCHVMQLGVSKFAKPLVK